MNTFKPIVLAAGIFAGLSLWAAITSEGFLEADACTHYLYSRFALEEPHYLVNVWGRPICTAIYALPAALAGRIGARITSLALALACAWIAYFIARRQEYRRPALAFVFTLAQPLVFLHSFSELTELPFATLIGLAFWMYQKRQWGAMALLVGLSPLARPEGFGFLLLALVVLALHRRWAWMPLLVLPLILWNHAGWVLFGRTGDWWTWLIENWPYATQSLYSSGAIVHFLVLLPDVTSPLIFPAMVIGVWKSLGRFWPPATHVQRCQAMIALIPLSIFIGHSVLYWLGKMASNGELRYMLIAAPFWALLSARGWEWAFERLDWRYPLRWAGAAALTPILAQLAYPVLPLVLNDDWVEARRIARWYEEKQSARYPYLSAAHPAILYFLDRSPTGPRARQWHRNTLLNPPEKTMLIWDPIYGVYNADAARSIRADEPARFGWRPLEVGDHLTGQWRFWVSQAREELDVPFGAGDRAGDSAQ